MWVLCWVIQTSVCMLLTTESSLQSRPISSCVFHSLFFTLLFLLFYFLVSTCMFHSEACKVQLERSSLATDGDRPSSYLLTSTVPLDATRLQIIIWTLYKRIHFENPLLYENLLRFWSESTPPKVSRISHSIHTSFLPAVPGYRVMVT